MRKLVSSNITQSTLAIRFVALRFFAIATRKYLYLQFVVWLNLRY